MKPTDWDPEFWTRTNEGEDTSVAGFIGAAAVVVLFVIAGFLWYVTLWAAQ